MDDFTKLELIEKLKESELKVAKRDMELIDKNNYINSVNRVDSRMVKVKITIAGQKKRIDELRSELKGVKQRFDINANMLISYKSMLHNEIERRIELESITKIEND